MTGTMLIFGMGYTSSHLAERLRKDGWQVAGTRRAAGQGADHCQQGVDSAAAARNRAIDPFTCEQQGASDTRRLARGKQGRAQGSGIGEGGEGGVEPRHQHGFTESKGAGGRSRTGPDHQ